MTHGSEPERRSDVRAVRVKVRIDSRVACWLHGEELVGEHMTALYDVAEHLRTPEDMAAYLEASIDEADGDAAFVAKALGDIARARGMAQVASDAGLSRESLYKALSGERVPTFETVLRVVSALGLRLRAEAALAAGPVAPGVSAHR